MTDTSLLGKIAIITGASQGIGAATARLFARQGAEVALLARSERLLAEETATIVALDGKALAVPVDLLDAAQIRQAFRTIEGTFGQPDILINCAGLVINKPFIDLTLADWDQVIGTNLRGTMLCCQEAFKAMQGRGGTIINVSSLSGVKNVEKFPGLSAYVASKFGVAGLTEALAIEGKPLGIRVMAVSPGAVDTPMLRAAAPHLNPGMQPDHMAAILSFMVSDAGRFLAGTNLELFSND